MGLFDSKPIVSFKQSNIVYRYELLMDSIYTIDKSITTSKVLIIWDLLVKQINENGYIIRLQTLEHSLVNTDDSPMEDLFQAIRAMMKMFSEIEVFVTLQGEVITVYNIADIRERYIRAKKELISFHGTSMRAEEVFNIPETEIDNPLLLNKRIQAMEFFDVYFGALFGRSFPKRYILKKKNLMQNLDIEYDLNGHREVMPTDPHCSQYIIKGDNYPISKKKLLELWGDAIFINKNELEFKGLYNASYIVNDQYGFIKEAELNIIEEFTPTFKLELKYTLKHIK